MLVMALFINQYVGDIINTYKAFVEKNILCLENCLSQYTIHVYTPKKDESNSELVFVLFINLYVGDIITAGQVIFKSVEKRNY